MFLPVKKYNKNLYALKSNMQVGHPYIA